MCVLDAIVRAVVDKVSDYAARDLWTFLTGHFAALQLVGHIVAIQIIQIGKVDK